MRMDINMDDYPNESQLFGYSVRSFRNSIGDISPPHYKFWNDLMTEAVAGNLPEQSMIYVMIYQIWFMWVIALTTQMIIFLNLIIAVLTQSYEKVISGSVNCYYLEASRKNLEWYRRKKFIVTLKPFDTFIISAANISAGKDNSSEN